MAWPFSKHGAKIGKIPTARKATISGWAEFVKGFRMDSIHGRNEKRAVMREILGFRDQMLNSDRVRLARS